jgi:hypothetical protein
MDVGLVVAGVICLAMAFGHTAIGVVWILPALSEDRLPSTPFGSKSLSVSMVRVTWYVVTVFVFGVGALLITIAGAPDSDAKVLVLRWLAAMWIAATAMAAWIALRRVRSLRGFLRLPVPLLWIVVAVLCWTASV